MENIETKTEYTYENITWKQLVALADTIRAKTGEDSTLPSDIYTSIQSGDTKRVEELLEIAQQIIR